jgi:hypothetical protein
MSTNRQDRLIEFLQADLQIPRSAVDTALRQRQSPHISLPMVLWHYGLITLEQLDQVFGWLETA